MAEKRKKGTADAATTRRKREPVPLDRSREIWYRQPGETDKAYDEFVAYRDSESRRVRDYSNGFHNSVRWSWQERVRAWDRHLNAQEAEKMIRYRLDMNERHRAIGRLAQTRAAQWLSGLTDEDVRRMKAGEVMKMLEVATTLERTAAQGDRADVTVDVTQTTNVVDLTARQTRNRLDSILEEVQRRREQLIEDGEIVEEDESDEEGTGTEVVRHG